jgi:uncharacterized coiled-coil protein SlyX
MRPPGIDQEAGMARKAKESAAVEGEQVSAEAPVERGVAVVPVTEAQYEPAPGPMAAQGPSVGQRLGKFFQFLFRLVLVVLLLGVIGAGLYFGLPLVYERYVLPVQENTDQLQQLRDQQSQSEQVVAELQARIAVLEIAQAENAQTFAGLETRVGELETEIAAHTEALTALDAMLMDAQAQNAATRAELERQIKWLKALELLSRARLFMYQSNFGLARQDVQAARDLLAPVQAAAPIELVDDLNAVLLRLDLALSNLPDFPVAASDDIDIAWQVLLGGLPQTLVSSTPVLEATPTITLSVTATPTPTPAETTESVTPTATP